ncbi:OLC1v1025447C1 [Oldenlandia corymbosa var. corymbosa]|uniref:OLC1v1025447C1 n=1 Tax=Oldenlandia corymbosa var. corymbosa TaxID=529605 RepID=A0AAV1C686_OLDCO|nr:OLC1v1025447C1 [Oldenlandia corymbosa var. corymbosa]
MLPILDFKNNNLTAFDGNHLSGTLPSTIGRTLPNLEGLYMATNTIGGPIPNSLSNCSNLQFIELAENNVTGPILYSLGDLRLLEVLDLDQNNLINDPSSLVLNFIASLANCKSLILSDNPLDTFFPDSVGNMSSSLEDIYASNCKIKGTIPSWIGNLSSLNTLALSDNQLTRPLPDSVKNWQNLQRLYLEKNKISISLKLFCGCSKLGVLDLEENLTVGGAIPYCLGNITSMRCLYLNSTGLNSSLLVSLWNLKDISELDISSNSLTGSLLLARYSPQLGQ